MPQILMPALSPTMEEGTLAKWLVAEGAKVVSGDVIAEIETDKATMEVEAIDEGLLTRIFVPAGTEGVKVNTPIAFIKGEDEQDAPADAPSPPAGEAAAAPSATVAKAPSPMPEAERPDAVSAPAQDEAAPQVAPEVPPGTAMRSQTMREALRDAMAEEMRRDGDVFLMGEEVAEYQGAYKISQGLLEEFGGKRVVDTPITEYGFAGLGVGAAMAGLKPIVEFMTFNFAMQAIDHIVNSAAKTLYMSGGQMRCPIVFRGPNGAASRVAAQHSQCFSAWYASVPGLKVIAPSNAADAKGLLKAAIRDPNPVVFLEHELLYGSAGEVPEGDIVLPIGRARVVRPGRDVTLVSFARGVIYCLDAAKALAEDGIEAEVIDLRTLRPLDMATVIASVKRTSRLVAVEEAWPVASIGAEVCAAVTQAAFDWLDAPPTRVSGADVPMPYAANLEKLALPNADTVAAAVRGLLGR